jgi:protein-disulfide isomerase
MGEHTSAPVPALREDDHVRGTDPAQPLLVLYADFTCPHCARAWLELRDVPARLCVRHLALRARHPRALACALAAEAASLQGAFWPFADALWTDQGSLEDPHLWARGEALGLDLQRFDADRRSERVAARVRRDVHDALRAGATGTPTLFSGGRSVAGPPYHGL